MDDRDLTSLRAEAIAQAMRDCQMDKDFLRHCINCWVDGLSPEELNDYVNPSEELLQAADFLTSVPFNS